LVPRAAAFIGLAAAVVIAVRLAAVRPPVATEERPAPARPAVAQVPEAALAVSVLLSPSQERGLAAAAARPTPPRSPAAVRLVLDLARDDDALYDVVIRTAEGRQRRRVTGLRSAPSAQGGRVVVLDLPADALDPADYVVVLSGRTSASATPHAL